MSNTKIAFFVELYNSRSKIRMANLDLGNPGVGGTQYLFLLTVKYLNKKKEGVKAVLLTDGTINFFDEDIVSEPDIYTVKDAIKYCETHEIETLVVNANWLDRVGEEELITNINIIVWAHNTLNWKRQCVANETPSVKKVVCVSEKQLNNMKDTPCSQKCIFINNVISLEFYEKAQNSDYTEKKVAYVGSLMPQKGVHNLLEIWRHVEKVEPTAELYIFGGSNVWNTSNSIGAMGITDLYYERIIKRKLRRLSHPENIHFMGAKGWDEIGPFISSFRVAVVNPSHYMRDETFCMSAIELSAHGIPIVSRKRGDGLETTIINNKTGFLRGSNKKIADAITELLSNESLTKEFGKAARSHAYNFTIEKEIEKWEELARCSTDTSRNHALRVISKDAVLLEFDFLLKLIFTISSGKWMDILAKKIKNL